MENVTINQTLNETVQQAQQQIAQGENILLVTWQVIRNITMNVRAVTAQWGTFIGFPPIQYTIPFIGYTIIIDWIILIVSGWIAYKLMQRKYAIFNLWHFISRTILWFALLSLI